MKNLFKFIAIVLSMIFVLSACGPAKNPDDTTDAVNGTDAPVTTEAIESTEDVIEGTEDAIEGTEDANSPLVNKKEFKILMIGNSFCSYFTEELYAIANAAGYDITVANLYESGCPVADHWKWLNDNSAEYRFYVTSTKYKGVQTQLPSKNNTTIQYALDYAKDNLGGDWDVISLQQHFHPGRALNYDKGYGDTSLYAKLLFKRIGKEHPESLLLWHETWAYQVGYSVPEYYVGNFNQDTPIPDVATQAAGYENIKKICYKIAEENGVNIVPCGDAWQIARADARVGDTMCARLDNKAVALENDNRGDYYHDGDIGGGQYLNACVWFETLTGTSCIGNTWRPEYKDQNSKIHTIAEDKIAALQEAAHAAVAAVYGENYAK